LTPSVYWFINQYASTPETGMGGRHYYLGQELAKRGHKVFVVCASFSHLQLFSPSVKSVYTIKELAPGFNYVWIRTIRYSHAHQIKRIFNWIIFSLRLFLLPKILREKPTAILFSSPSLLPWLTAWALSRRLGARLVWDVRDLWPLTFTEAGGISRWHPLVLIHQLIENLACRHSAHIISNWPNAIDYLKLHGADATKFTWIPNGFAKSEFESATQLPRSILTQIPKERFIVGYLGTFGEINSIPTLLKAALIMAENTSVHFVLVGKGKLEKEIDDFIARFNLSNITRLTAIPKSDVPAMLRRFSVCYVGFRNSPLYRYGFSLNKLPEYLMSGRPIIIGIKSSFSPISDALAGLSISPESPKELVRAILRLYEMTQAERDRLGKNGQSYAESNFEYSSLSLTLLDVLDAVTATR
jgi:glycosyltransferase involved in cell wall biosynthesis